MLIRITLLSTLIAAWPAQVAVAQDTRWLVGAEDTTGVASATPSPLHTWRAILPLRRGIALWARNPTPDSVSISSVEVWGCVNIGAGCGRTLTDTIIAPGDSLILVVVRPLKWNDRYGFRSTHMWAPVGGAVQQLPPYSMPAWAVARLDAAAFVEHYQEAQFLNPNVLEPDFNGDGRSDLAITIRNHAGAPGLAVLLAGKPELLTIGAGQPAAGADFLTKAISWEVVSSPDAKGQQLRVHGADGTVREIRLRDGVIEVTP